MQRLRIFVSSPNDVAACREIAAQTIEKLSQDYARHFQAIEPYLWEHEAMLASGHFEDSIQAPSAFDIVVLILWSRLGTPLPARTAVREYRGADGRVPVTGTEWEYEEALVRARKDGAPDLLVYRNLRPAPVDTRDAQVRDRQLHQLEALDEFWSRHFANRGVFLGAYTEFTSDADFAVALEAQLRKLIERRVTGMAKEDRAAPAVWTHAPFRGLEAYQFEHAPIYFGRDSAIADAMRQLAEGAAAKSPFLLVLGASGSGKSSLARAGIVPKLFVPRRISGSAFLRRVIFRPGDAEEGEDIFDALARRLTTRISEQEGLPELTSNDVTVADLAAHLRGAAAEPALPFRVALGGLAGAARRAGHMLEYETAKLILVVDQLEELFTNERISVDDRRRFVKLLAGLVHSDSVWVIATMRSDFWHRAAETPELVDLCKGAGRIDFLPPSPAELGQMIRRPAEAAGVEFETHPATTIPLNDIISEQVASQPGALPLLSYLLDQLYQVDVRDAHQRTLTFATYERLGKLEGAIAAKAEAVLDRCAPEDREALGSVFFSLVQMGSIDGDAERAVARRAPLSAFSPGTPQRRLVEALLEPDARLLVSDLGREGAPTVRLAHEALITHWSRARDSVLRNAAALRIRRRIEERYRLWLALDRGFEGATVASAPIAGLAARLLTLGQSSERELGLLTEIDLADGQRLLADHSSELAPELAAYVQRSVASESRIRNRSFRILAGVAAAVTGLAVIASGAGVVATIKQHEAEVQADRALQAQSRLLTEAASLRLQQGAVADAEAIILEVIKRLGLKRTDSAAAAINVFQEARGADRQLAVLSGHTNPVERAVFSPDGQRVATASIDGTARIWDATTGKQLVVLAGHQAPVNSVAFSPDGRRIVTAADDKTARIWDAATGVQLAVLVGHADTVMSAVYSPDGQRIVTASADKTARVWNASTGAQLGVLAGHSRAVDRAAFSPDGRWIVTGSLDSTARVWDSARGGQIAVLSGHTGPVNSVAFSPDGKRIVTGSDDKTARVWDAASGVQIMKFSGHSDLVEDAAFSPDGRRVVTASYDATARIWDADTGLQLAILAGHAGGLKSATYSADGRRVVTASLDQTARIWDTAGAQSATLVGHQGMVLQAIYSPDGQRIVTVSGDETIRVWDARTGAPVGLLAGSNSLVNFVDFSPDGRRIVTASGDRTARIWDVASGAQLMVLKGHTAAVACAKFSPDGRLIVTTSYDKTARVWDATTGAQRRILAGHSDAVLSGSFSPDGRRIVTASIDRTVRIWDADTGVQVVVASGHDGAVDSAVYSPDGRSILSASYDNTARIWDSATGAQRAVLSGHEAPLMFAAYSPDGRHIVTASEDRTARIWETATGKELDVLDGHDDAVESAAYSPDGRHIVTASDDKTARIWNAGDLPDLSVQVAWSRAAQFDPLSDTERAMLGLPATPRAWQSSSRATDCDRMAAAPYDPDRRAQGKGRDDLVLDVAVAACSREIAASPNSARLNYQLGRLLSVKRDWAAAKAHLERAVDLGSRAALIDLGDLRLQPDAHLLAPDVAASLYEKAWRKGVAIGAFRLGRLDESGAPASDGRPAVLPNVAKATFWYQAGAQAREPNALARMAERAETAAIASGDSAQTQALLLTAFERYAGAAAVADSEAWPDEDWRLWRYRRATLARLLAREGGMQQVADVYESAIKADAPR